MSEGAEAHQHPPAPADVSDQLADLMVPVPRAVTYWVALRLANNAYDRSLLDPALDIADNVRLDDSGAHVDLPQKALEALVYDQVDKVIFQVRSRDERDHRWRPGPAAAARLGPGQHIFFDADLPTGRRSAWPRIAIGERAIVVQVGETLHKRNRLIGEILVAELVSTLLIAMGRLRSRGSASPRDCSRSSGCASN